MLETTVKNASPQSTYIDSMETMGERIASCRDRRGLSLETVASAIGISAQALSQWENGQTTGIRPENLLNFCAYFHVDPYWLVFGKALDEGGAGRFRRLSAS